MTARGASRVVVAAPERALETHRCRWRELAAVYRVHRACFPYPYPFWRFVGYQLSPVSCIRVATVPGGIIGYVVATVTEHVTGRRGEIISLAVLEPWRRRRVATRLLREAAAFLRRVCSADVYLQVAVDNAAAQELYDSLGFRKVERLIGYYLGGEDAWLMCRSVERARRP